MSLTQTIHTVGIIAATILGSLLMIIRKWRQLK